MKNIKLDRPELSDNEILKYKNFNKLSNAVNSTNAGNVSNISMFKTFKFWGISGAVIVATSVIIALTMFSNNIGNVSENFDFKNTNKISEKLDGKNSILDDNTINVLSKINPPFPEADIPYEKHIIDNTKDTTIQNNGGSLLFIPSYAFENINGEPINEKELEIKYREFHSTYDIFVSGIPMQYDSAGVSYTFESAGMLDIMAYDDNNQELELKRGKKIKVDMISRTDRTDFNLYKLNKETGAWKHLGKDKVTPLNKPKVLQNVAAVEKEIPLYTVKPILQNKKKYAFEVELNDDFKYDFANIDKVLFEIDDTKCNFDPTYYSVAWENIDIEKIDEVNYKLRLSKNDVNVELIAYPVYKENDYNNAIIKYKKSNEQSQKEKDQILNKRKKQIENKTDFDNINKWCFNGSLATRSFDIPGLGVFNCDLALVQNEVQIKPEFVDDSNNNIAYKNVYVAEKDKNKLDVFSNKMPSIRVSTKSKQNMWLITNENNIAIVDNASVNDIKDNSESKTFNVKEYEYVEGLKKVKDMFDGQAVENTKKQINTKTYPNPFTNEVSIELFENQECIVQLLNVKGQMVDNITFIDKKYTWQLDKHKAGSYIIVVIIPSLKYKESFRIIKM